MIQTDKTDKAHLGACKRVLAKIYNTHSNMVLALRIEILVALGYGDDQKAVGALLSGQAYLTEDGVIDYLAAEASNDWPNNR